MPGFPFPESGKDQLLILASGPAPAAQVVGPVFDVIGRKTVWPGDAGRGCQAATGCRCLKGCPGSDARPLRPVTAAKTSAPRAWPWALS